MCTGSTTRRRKASAARSPSGPGAHPPSRRALSSACRGRRSGSTPAGPGRATATAFGNRVRRGDANYRMNPRLDGDGPPSSGRATPAGSFRANGWGIHNMSTNIFEWCRDWYHAALPGGVNPDVQVKGEPNRNSRSSHRASRSGLLWNDDATWYAWQCRPRFGPERNSNRIGFRVVLVAVQSATPPRRAPTREDALVPRTRPPCLWRSSASRDRLHAHRDRRASQSSCSLVTLIAAASGGRAGSAGSASTSAFAVRRHRGNGAGRPRTVRLRAILFFGVMTDAGLLNPIVGGVLRVVGQHPTRMVIGSALLALVAHLDSCSTVTFLSDGAGDAAALRSAGASIAASRLRRVALPPG